MDLRGSLFVLEFIAFRKYHIICRYNDFKRPVYDGRSSRLSCKGMLIFTYLRRNQISTHRLTDGIAPKRRVTWI